MTTAERTRRHKAAARATVIGSQAAAVEFGLPRWAVDQALGEIGKQTATPHHGRENRRAIAHESSDIGVPETAAKYGLTIETIKQYRSEFGATPRLRRKQVLSIAAKLVRGIGPVSLAKEYSVSVSTIEAIHRECRDVGLMPSRKKNR